MAPRLAAFNDQITQNETLFKRIEAVYNSPAKAKLTPEQQRLTWLYYTNFVRAGAQLGRRRQERVSRRSTSNWPDSYTKFSQNVLAEEDRSVHRAEDRRPNSPDCRSRCAMLPPPRPRPRSNRARG